MSTNLASIGFAGRVRFAMRTASGGHAGKPGVP